MTAWESVTDIFRDVFSKGWNFVTDLYDKVGILQFLIVVFGIYLSLRYIIFPLISRNSGFWGDVGLSAEAVDELSDDERTIYENSAATHNYNSGVLKNTSNSYKHSRSYSPPQEIDYKNYSGKGNAYK